MSEALYDKMFRRLEKVRWQLADIPYESIDRAAVPQDTIDFVRVTCLMEMSSLYATRMFLRDFQHNPDFCQFMSIWYYEEMRHYLALREYLKVFDAAPDHRELPQYDVELAPAPWPNTLAMHWCGELRLGRWYLRWAEGAEEPVLEKIMRHIAEDEFRHAQCYEEFMQAALQEQPELLNDFINTAKWMLMNPRGDKHPTTMAEVNEDGIAVTDRIEGYENFLRRVNERVPVADEISLETRVLKTFSRLSGRELQSKGDLVRLSRDLAATSTATPNHETV
jgi:rubrerythrin